MEDTQVLVGDTDRWDIVLTDEAISFVTLLVRTFSSKVSELLTARKIRQGLFDLGLKPHFIEARPYNNIEEIKNSNWKAASLPSDLLDRRVEITGPVDRKMIINALNSGANVFMADFEDSNCPTWDNLMQGQVNLMDAVRKTVSYTAPNGKEYKLNDSTAILMVRPRGWHLVEKHFIIDGNPAPAGLVDFGLYLFHNAQQLISNHTGPYFYLPKMENSLEAKLWNDVIEFSQRELNLPPSTIRVTCLIETITAAFEMDEIIWELRNNIVGLNCGRWDYIFSFIKKLSQHSDCILPDRSQITMDKAFLDAYVRLLIQTCHRRGIHAMGGMAAQIPIKNDPVANDAALAKVRADKFREVHAGHDGTWVAHPALVSIAREIFDQGMVGANQIDVQLNYSIAEEQLLEVHTGPITEAGLRHNVRVGIQYIESWLRGIGCVPIYNLMEDAATAELSRAQVWQWLHYQVGVGNSPLTMDRFLKIVDEEMSRIQSEINGEAFVNGKFLQACQLFIELSTSPTFEEFLTIKAYDLL